MAWGDFLWWCVCSWVSKCSVKGFLFSDNGPFSPDTRLVVFPSLTVDNSLDAARSSRHGLLLEGLLERSCGHSLLGATLTEALLTWKLCGLSALGLVVSPLYFVLSALPPEQRLYGDGSCFSSLIFFQNYHFPLSPSLLCDCLVKVASCSPVPKQRRDS